MGKRKRAMETVVMPGNKVWQSDYICPCSSRIGRKVYAEMESDREQSMSVGHL